MPRRCSIRRPLGDNVRLEADITDDGGTAFNPVTVKVTVKDPAGVVKVNAADMVNYGTGLYYYRWQSAITDAAGSYTWFVEAAQGNVGKQDRKFTLYAV